MTTARLEPFGTTIFAEMTGLAQRTGAVNLGQGFPDEDGPAAIMEAAAAAMRAGHNQYAPARGVPALREAIAEHQARHHGLAVDPDAGVLVTFGATEAIAAALIGLCEPDDEVVLIEPSYDAYAAQVAIAGALRRTVTLRPPHFALDPDALRAAVTPRTRAIIVNSPHNPTGRVLSRDELGAVAALCVEHDLIALSDEVYEHLTYDGAEHVALASLPGMAERTLTVSSLGKSFSLTGWKVGWLSGAPALIDAAATAKQFLSFAGGTPFQHAAAHALRGEDAAVAALRDALQGKRDRLRDGLTAAGLEMLPAPAGAYFLTADVGEDAAAFCWALPERAGVVAVPLSAFYDDAAAGGAEHLVRFAFCKRDEVLDEAVRRLTAAGRTGRP